MADTALFSLNRPSTLDFSLQERGSSGRVGLGSGSQKILGDLSSEESDFFGAAASLVVSGLYRPETIEFHWPSLAASASEFLSLAHMLYDVRAYCEDDDFFYPRVVQPRQETKPRERTEKETSASSGYDTLLLFSGGIDSTYSLIKLHQYGSKVLALYLDMNLDTLELERKAVTELARYFGTPVIYMDLCLEGFPRRGDNRVGSDKFGEFPIYNSVPHGREILSLALACIVARRYGISNIAVGQEKDSIEKTVMYQGKTIYRHDVESRVGHELMSSWIHRQLPPGPWNIFSPIGNMSIQDIRETMLFYYPEVLATTQSCFWERQCERCVKCVSIYVLQRVLGKEVFRFTSNPLDDPGNEELEEALSNEGHSDKIGFYGQILECLRNLSSSPGLSGEYWIRKYIAMEHK